MFGAAARRHLAAFWLICMTADLDDSWGMQVAARREELRGRTFFGESPRFEAFMVTWAEKAATGPRRLSSRQCLRGNICPSGGSERRQIRR